MVASWGGRLTDAKGCCRRLGAMLRKGGDGGVRNPSVRNLVLGRSPEIACISSGNRFTIRIQSRNPAFVHCGWRVWRDLRGVAATSCSSLLRRGARRGSAFRAHGRSDRSDGSGFRSSCRCFRLRRVGCLWRGHPATARRTVLRRFARRSALCREPSGTSGGATTELAI